MELYTPVIVLALIAAGFAVFSVIMSVATGPRRYNRAKLDSYECGIEPTPQPVGGGKVPVKYYTVAMTFIIFDVEIMFLVPWAVYFDQLHWFGLAAVTLFLFNITIAYAYEWRRGGLDWD
jgi:NADH-quinone oxidoreductase subunit A